MANQVQENRNVSISMIRLTATVMIVVCHMMQYEDFVLAWWLNAGVQIFLCMSGYLYGCKGFKGKAASFYKKQFLKILLDYYIVILFVILLQFCFHRSEISVLLAVKSLLTLGTLSGGGHLWYIPYILFCYFLIPFYEKFCQRLFARTNSIIFLGGGILLLMCVIFCLTGTVLSYFNSAWLNCFLIGFFIGKCEYYGRKSMERLAVTIIDIAAFFMNGIQIYTSYAAAYSFSETEERLYAIFCNYAHVALGCFLFFAMKRLFSNILGKNNPAGIQSICAVTDNYSYDVYLVHQFFILGPFTLMRFTESSFVNIIVIVICVVFAALFVNRLSRYIKENILPIVFGKSISKI